MTAAGWWPPGCPVARPQRLDMLTDAEIKRGLAWVEKRLEDGQGDDRDRLQEWMRSMLAYKDERQQDRARPLAGPIW